MRNQSDQSDQSNQTDQKKKTETALRAFAGTQGTLDFDTLVSAIRQVHEHLAAQAGRAVNISLTMRNWLIGAYIAEYELCGADRAAYGEAMLVKLAGELKKKQVSTCGKRQLYNYLRFYQTYPEIVRSLSAQLKKALPFSLIPLQKKVRSVTALSEVGPEKLLNHFSYTHIEQLLAIDDPLKRSFYEIECIRGNWSVRELKRQIVSLYYERSGLSENKEKLAEMVQSGAEQALPTLAIRDPYVFEFLGLKSKEVMSESDLVFYHRLLKCHVLIDLKIENFTHENIGQLNTYVSWYRKNIMTDGDNPPIGILLCTQKDHALVEYALAGMDNSMFVSKYQLELPSKEDMQRFLEENIQEVSET